MGVSIELLEIVVMGFFSCEISLVLPVTSYIPDAKTGKQKPKNRVGQNENKTKQKNTLHVVWLVIHAKERICKVTSNSFEFGVSFLSSLVSMIYTLAVKWNETRWLKTPFTAPVFSHREAWKCQISSPKQPHLHSCLADFIGDSFTLPSSWLKAGNHA